MGKDLLHGELAINFSKADECYEAIKVKLTTPGPDLEAGDLERELHTQGLELMRRFLEARLNAMTQSHSTVRTRNASRKSTDTSTQY